MRTERRHELQTNELAKDLGMGLNKLRPHMTTVVTVVGAAVVLFGGFSYWRSAQAESAAQAWGELQSAMLTSDPTMAEVQKVMTSEKLGGQEAQEWAAIAWADRQLFQATEELFLFREAADERIKSVEEIYKQFSSNATSDEVRNRARLGLGRVCELRNELADAKKHYGRVQGPLQGIAKDRLEALERPDAADDLAWLAEAEGILPVMPPGGGIPGARPAFGVDAPATEGGQLPFNPDRPLEDILSGFGEGDSDSGRYDEPAADDSAADETPEASGSDGPAMDDSVAADEKPAAAETAADAAAEEPAADAEQ